MPVPWRLAQALAQADIATYQGADRTQKLVEGAKKEGTFTIYTSATVDDMAALTGAFEKKYGVKPQVWRASSENIIQRAATEARGGRFDVDVFETDGVAMEAMHREKLLQVVKSPVLSDLIPAAIPAHKEWIGDRVQIFTAAYNTNLVKKADLPKTLRGPRRPQMEGQARDRSRRQRLVFRCRDRDGRGEGPEAVPRHRGQERPVGAQGPHAAGQPRGFGRSAAGADDLSLQGRAAQERRRADRLVRAAARGRARPGHRPRAQAPHPHAGVLFMDFLLSDAQAILAKRDFIPTNVKVKPLPEGMTLKFVDPAKILDENDKWEKLYKDIITNQAR